MKALMKMQRGPGFIEICEINYPKLPAEDWVIVKVKAVGICGTDLHIYHDQDKGILDPPFVLGHEFSGEIVEIGSEVKNWKPKDRVVGETHVMACGKCRICREGNMQFCKSKRPTGRGGNGAFADYAIWPAHLLHKIPDNVTYEIAAMTEPLATAVTGVAERIKISCSDYVVVTGAGPIGILCAFVAKSQGARKVVMTGLDASKKIRMPVALQLGVDEVINIQHEDALKKVLAETDGWGADVVIECSGSQAAIAQALAMVRKTGQYSGIGLSTKEVIDFPYNQLIIKNLNLMTTHTASYTSFDRALWLMSTTKMDLNNAISHKIKLDQWKEAFELLEREEGVKIVVTFD